jgi:hypothetical protein
MHIMSKGRLFQPTLYDSCAMYYYAVAQLQMLQTAMAQLCTVHTLCTYQYVCRVLLLLLLRCCWRRMRNGFRGAPV